MSTLGDNASQKGVNAVEAIFLKIGWLFRRQLESDHGIDAQVEIVEDGRATGQLIALQIKSGYSYFRKRSNNFVYYGEERHLNYWENHSLPVLIVLHDFEKGITVWQRIERHVTVQGAGGAWSIDIPPHRTLNEHSGEAIKGAIPRSDPENTRRHRIRLDAGLIRLICDNKTVFMEVDEWINKSLGFRGADIYFENPESTEANEHIPFVMASHSVSDVFDEFFPWLDFSYYCTPVEHAGELLVHTFEVQLNELGKAFLKLEDFFQDGPEPSPDPVWPSPSPDDIEDDEYEDYMRRQAQIQDWENEAPDDTNPDVF